MKNILWSTTMKSRLAHAWPWTVDNPLRALCGIKKLPQDITNSRYIYQTREAAPSCARCFDKVV